MSEEYNNKCQKCGGTGKYIHKKKLKKQNSYILSYKKCPVCKGKGFIK